MNKIIKIINEGENIVDCLVDIGNNHKPIYVSYTLNEYKVQVIKETIYDKLVSLKASRNEIAETLNNIGILEGLAWERGQISGYDEGYDDR
jgi:S-methylmethionine-dependent homocysteine/selenocysteine methylase